MLEKYFLVNHDWLKGIFEEKEKEVRVYGRHMFISDMKSTQHRESMNNVLKKHLKPKHYFMTFFRPYSRLLAYRQTTFF